MVFFISVIVFFIFFIRVLGMLSNVSTTKMLREKTIREYINSKSTLSYSLSENKLMLLRKIYKKKFKSNLVYKVNGVLYYGSGSSQTRWYDLSVNGMRVETVHAPYKIVSTRKLNGYEFLNDDSFNNDLLCDFENKKVEIEGVVHKNCFYVSRIDGFDVIDEIMPVFSLRKTLNITKLDFSFIGFSLIAYLSLFFATSIPSNGTLIFFTLCVFVSILGSIFLLYHITKGYKIEGVYKERKIYYDEEHDWKCVGTIGNVLIDSQIPLIDGKHYQAVLTDLSVRRTGLMHVEKINGHNYEQDNTNGSIMLFVFLCVQFLLALAYYEDSKDSIQEELKTFYNHNVEKFGVEEPSKIIRDNKDLDNIELKDFLTVFNVYYSSEGEYFLFFEGGLPKNNYSLKSSLYHSCRRGNTKAWINTVNKKVKHIRFKFDSNIKENEKAKSLFEPGEVDHKKICDEKYSSVVRLALCQDCSQRESKPIKGIVSRIDQAKKTIYLTNDLDPGDYPTQVARYKISLVVLLSAFIYFLMGFGGIVMHYEISRKNKSEDKTWVSWP